MKPATVTTTETTEAQRLFAARNGAKMIVRYLAFDWGVTLDDEALESRAAEVVALLRRDRWKAPLYDPTQQPRGCVNPPRVWTEEDARKLRLWRERYRSWLRSLPPPPKWNE